MTTSGGQKGPLIDVLMGPLTGSSVCLGLLLSRSLFELHLAKVKDGRRAPIKTHLFRLVKTENAEGILPHIGHRINFSASDFTCLQKQIRGCQLE